jgi:hypothetical protein
VVVDVLVIVEVAVVAVVHGEAPFGHTVVPLVCMSQMLVPAYLQGPEVPKPQSSHNPGPLKSVFVVVDDMVLVVVHSDMDFGQSPSSVFRAQIPVPGILHGPLVP